jgi:hypothetical protein
MVSPVSYASPATQLISRAGSPGCSTTKHCGARRAWPGRPRYEEDFVGENVIDQYFRPLLGSATATESERREVKNSGV